MKFLLELLRSDFLEEKKKKRKKENPINEPVPAIVLFVPPPILE